MDEVDYSLYPEKKEQVCWLRCYLEAKAKLSAQTQNEVSEEEVERLYVQVNKCACVSA